MDYTKTLPLPPPPGAGVDPGYYHIIPAPVFYDREIVDAAKLLYGLISALTRRRGYAWASNETLAREMGCSGDHARALLKQLEDRGYVSRETLRDPSGIVTERRLFLCPNPAPARDGREDFAPPLPGKFRGPSPENSPDPSPENSGVNNTSKKNITSGRASARAGLEAVTIPSGLDTEAFRNIWVQWVDHRTSGRLKFTPAIAERQLKALAAVGERAAIATLNASLTNGWAGIFPDRHSAGGRGGTEAARRRTEGGKGFNREDYAREAQAQEGGAK